MRKAEFKAKAISFYAPTYWSKGKELKHFQIFRSLSYRWGENEPNPIEDDIEYHFTEEEAIEAAESINLEVGFAAIVERIKFLYDDWNEAYDFREEFELDDLNYKTISSLDVDSRSEIRYNSGENIKGGIVVEWSYERYVGYARNLLQIGMAGEYPFYNFETEDDLISGNEERTFHSNYSLLLTPEEVEGLTNEELEEAIREELNKGHWKWNYFKNNPDTIDIMQNI